MRTVLAAAAAVVAAQPQQACPGAETIPSAGNLGAVRSATHCLVNAERRRHGVRPVRADRDLRQAAHRYARRMAARDFCAHVSPSGRDLRDRVRASGYLRGAHSWTAGENLAWGSGRRATPVATVRAWMRSPGHRANLLSPAFEELGAGVASGAPQRGVRGPAATYVTVHGTVRR